MQRNLFLTRLEADALVFATVAGGLKWRDGLKTAESYNLENANLIYGLYRDYIKAGVDIIVTNTLGANRAQLVQYGLEKKIREINLRGMEIAQKAAEGRVLVAGAIGPTGKYTKTVNESTFEQVLDIFREQIVALNEGRPDLLFVKNISEIREMKAALIACRELFRGPIISEMALGVNGNDSSINVESILTILAPFQPDVVGISSSKYSELLHFLDKMNGLSQIRLSVSLENSPRERVTPEEMGDYALQLVETGASLVGSGTAITPEHVREIAFRINHLKPVQRSKNRIINLASQKQVIALSKEFPTVFIGERLNPQTNPLMKEYLQAGRTADILTLAQKQIQSGARILELCVAVPKVHQASLMARYVNELEKVESVVLCLRSEKTEVLEAGLQTLAGKGLVRLTTHDEQKLSLVLRIVKKYGATIIITPDTFVNHKLSTEKLMQTLERQLAICRDYHVKDEDIWIDCSLRTPQAKAEDLGVAINLMQQIKIKLALKTVCSLPGSGFSKTILNSFLAIALANGLDVPIINPFDSAIRRAISATDSILGRVRNEH